MAACIFILTKAQVLYLRADVCCAGHSRRGMKQKLTGNVMGKGNDSLESI